MSKFEIIMWMKDKTKYVHGFPEAKNISEIIQKHLNEDTAYLKERDEDVPMKEWLAIRNPVAIAFVNIDDELLTENLENISWQKIDWSKRKFESEVM